MRARLFALSAAALVTVSLVAHAKLSSTGSSVAGFHATGPAGLNIDAKTSELSVADDGTTVTVTVPFANIDTGMTLRNKHCKEDLEADKFPSASLRVARSALKFPAASTEASGDAKGSLTVHGVTKDVTFHYSAKLNGDTYDVKGSTRINVGDFGVKPRSYLGVSIKPDVEVYASFSAKDS